MRAFRRRELVVILFWAVALAVLLNMATDFWRLKYYRPRSTRWNLNAYALQQSGKRADILFLGSSRTRLGINTNFVLDALSRVGHEDVSAFNVAQPASGVVTNQILLRDLIRSNGCPDVILLEASPAALNQNGDWWPNVGDYATVKDFPNLFSSVTSLEQLDFVLVSGLRGGVRLYDRLATPPEPRALARQLATSGSPHRTLTEHPAEIGEGPPKRALRRAERAHRRSLWRNMDVRGSTVGALRHSAALAAGCSARLVLVDLPSLISYRPEDEQRIRLPYLNAIREFTSSHDAVFFDATTADLGIQPGHFSDAVHLNLAGSILFSEYLAREVLLPALDRNSARTPESGS